MAKVLVCYYSMYGHVEIMANAIAEGANSVAGTSVDLRRVPDIMSDEALRNVGGKVDQAAPLAAVNDLPNYDAIIFGTPTRFGNMCAQMRNFLDQTGALWATGKLVGKVGSVFTSTATQHGGQETTLTSFHNTLMHHGMIIVGMPYAIPETQEMGEVCGGTPYGASTLAGTDGSRQPSAKELTMARYQGSHVADIASRLFRA